MAAIRLARQLRELPLSLRRQCLADGLGTTGAAGRPVTSE